MNTKYYQGDPDSWAIVFDPPPELDGKLNVVPEMNDIVNSAIMYVGGEPCTNDRAVLKKVRDVLMTAKPNWLSMGYASPEVYAKEDVAGGANWNGYTFRARLLNPAIKLRLSQGRLSRSGWTTWPSSRTPRTSTTPSCS